MTPTASYRKQHRHLLKWASASPLLSLSGGRRLFAQGAAKRPDPMIWPATILTI